MKAAETHRKLTDALNRRDSAAFAELYAPNAVVHDPAYDTPLEGRDAVRRDMETFLRTLPDLTVTVRSRIEADGMIASDGVFTGTHEGPLVTPTEEIPASGRSIAFSGAGFYRFDGQGRILEEHRYYDLAGILAQIGVLA